MKESDGVRTISQQKTFRDALIDLRALCKLTQLGMALELGISMQYYHDLEKGRRLPSVNIAHAITRFCQLGHRKAAGRSWHILAARTHGWDI